MFKLCITHYALFRRLSGISWLRFRVVFDLAAIDRIRSAEAFEAIVSSIQLANGTYKTTGRNRFSDLDEILVEVFEQERMGEDPIRLHDVAVSDGITTLQLYRRLEREKLNFTLVASDLFNRIYVRSSCFGRVRKIYDAQGRFLSASVLGLYANPRLPAKQFLSRQLGRWLDGQLDDFRQARAVMLLAPELARSEARSRIRFEDYDIFEFSQADCFDAVRCMNILNLSYFSTIQLKQALARMHASLRDGGIFLVGRTDVASGVNNASVYRKEKAGFTEISSVNDGSEIADIILEFSVVIAENNNRAG